MSKWQAMRCDCDMSTVYRVGFVTMSELLFIFDATCACLSEINRTFVHSDPFRSKVDRKGLGLGQGGLGEGDVISVRKGKREETIAITNKPLEGIELSERDFVRRKVSVSLSLTINANQVKLLQ